MSVDERMHWFLYCLLCGSITCSPSCVCDDSSMHRYVLQVFPNSHAFYRWRSTQILHYHIYHPTDLETKTSSYVANRNSPSSGTDSSKYDGNLSSALGLVSNMEEYNIEQLMEGNVGCDDDIGNVSCVDKKEFDSANTHITRIHLWKPGELEGLGLPASCVIFMCYVPSFIVIVAVLL